MLQERASREERAEPSESEEDHRDDHFTNHETLVRLRVDDHLREKRQAHDAQWSRCYQYGCGRRDSATNPIASVDKPFVVFTRHNDVAVTPNAALHPRSHSTSQLLQIPRNFMFPLQLIKRHRLPASVCKRMVRRLCTLGQRSAHIILLSNLAVVNRTIANTNILGY